MIANTMHKSKQYFLNFSLHIFINRGLYHAFYFKFFVYAHEMNNRLLLKRAQIIENFCSFMAENKKITKQTVNQNLSVCYFVVCKNYLYLYDTNSINEYKKYGYVI